MSTGLEAFTADGGALLVATSSGSDSVRLVSIDAHSGDVTVVAEEQGADLHQVRLHPRRLNKPDAPRRALKRTHP